MKIFILISWIINISIGKKLSHNLNFNGPFNPYIKESPRRLVADSSASENVAFYHGIASGDPTDTDVLLWTRVTPPYQDEYALDRDDIYNSTEIATLKSIYETISVDYAISTSIEDLDLNCDDSMCGSMDTSDDIDYTVKVIVDNLSPNTWYYYQFKVGNAHSEIGRTRTIPSSNEEINSWRFAFGSCKQVTGGYFNNLGDIADRDDLDMMVWLGDSIYEFPDTGLVNGSAIGRTPFPNNYLYELEHYRGRHKQDRLFETTKALSAKLPWYIVWDDHEVVNDYWKTGAPDRWQDDDLFGVQFAERRLNGYQAFFEWQPIRPLDVDNRGGLYRSYQFGDLFTLLMVDARSQRTEETENVTISSDLSVDEHYAFGETQRNWILDELNTSQSRGVKWRLFGSSDVFGQSPTASIFDGELFFGEDNLEGYHNERQIILDYIMDNNIDNVISMAGGPHTGIAQKVFSTGEPIENDVSSFPIMTEFTVDAIAAPKLFETSTWLPYIDTYADEWGWVSPYFRLLNDGYSVMTVTKEKVKVEYWINNDTSVPTTKSRLDIELCVLDGVVEFYECDEMNKTTTLLSTMIDTDPEESMVATEPSGSSDESGVEDDDSNDDGQVWMIIAIIFMVLFVIVVIILGYYCYSTKKEKEDAISPSGSRYTHQKVESGVELGDVVDEKNKKNEKTTPINDYTAAENDDLL